MSDYARWQYITEAESSGAVRGFVAVPAVPQSPQWGTFAVAEALGKNGFLTVVKDLRLRDLYQSIVPFAAGDIEADLAFYLNQSEQIPSLLALGVHLDEDGQVAAAGGLLIQSLPPYNPDVITMLRERLEEMPPVGELLAQQGRAEQLLNLLFGALEIKLLGQQPLYFQCTCSRERSLQAVKSLSSDEVVEMLAAEEQIVVDCHFCHERYIFDREDLAGISD